MSDSDRPTGPGLRADRLRAEAQSFQLGPVDFQLRPGEVLVVFGPNGAGKSTLLRVLAGLEPVTGGTLWLDGVDITRTPGHRRRVGMVFQDLALFPQLSVWENLAYGPRAQRWREPDVAARVEELVGDFRLQGLAERRPAQLSGGEQQRVALARALAPRPRLLLFDEPLSSADREIRSTLQREIRDRVLADALTAVYVTHDLDEGVALASRMGFLKDGRWLAEGPAGAIRTAPRSRFIAGFLGFNVRQRQGQWVAGDPSKTDLLPIDAPDTVPGILREIRTEGDLVHMHVSLGNEGSLLGPTLHVLRWGSAGDLHVLDRVGVRFREEIPLPDE